MYAFLAVASTLSPLGGWASEGLGAHSLWGCVFLCFSSLVPPPPPCTLHVLAVAHKAPQPSLSHVYPPRQPHTHFLCLKAHPHLRTFALAAPSTWKTSPALHALCT